ncbi:hypothetical protein CSKR_203622 [Clonorchis sinensis]|uniref:Uncharacterized protein n=1 Tax=Clonorchis sinensis TaxID=79923 RepID=A0A8T1MCG0_CLOSI|nr:hypothetical protein CSKR_203622 [Clonorchis sinensis]
MNCSPGRFQHNHSENQAGPNGTLTPTHHQQRKSQREISILKGDKAPGVTRNFTQIPLTARSRCGRKAYLTQDLQEIWDACRSGIKPSSDWSKVFTQQPIMTQCWPNAHCQWRIQNASEFSKSCCRLRYVHEALYKCS